MAQTIILFAIDNSCIQMHTHGGAPWQLCHILYMMLLNNGIVFTTPPLALMGKPP